MNRGDVFQVRYEPVERAVGREQGGVRPGVIVSADRMNNGPYELVIVVPFTTASRLASPFRVRAEAGDGGLPQVCWAICEQPRTLSIRRLGKRYGRLPAEMLRIIEGHVRAVLGLLP